MLSKSICSSSLILSLTVKFSDPIWKGQGKLLLCKDNHRCNTSDFSLRHTHTRTHTQTRMHDWEGDSGGGDGSFSSVYLGCWSLQLRQWPWPQQMSWMEDRKGNTQACPGPATNTLGHFPRRPGLTLTFHPQASCCWGWILLLPEWPGTSSLD